MSHLSSGRAKGPRETFARLLFWYNPFSFTPVVRDEPEPFVGVTDCRLLDWFADADVYMARLELRCRAWWERNGLLMKQAVAPFVVFGGFTIAGIYAIKFGLWLSEGVAR